MLDPTLIAKIKIKLESDIEVSASYRTLFAGLKWNQERNSQILYPLAFLLRRISFIVAACLFVNQPIFAVITFLCLVLVMLAYSMHERQWKESYINYQNIFNETMLYAIAVLLLVCRGEFALDWSEPAGNMMLWCVGILVTVNGAALVRSAIRSGILLANKVYYATKARKRTKAKEAL